MLDTLPKDKTSITILDIYLITKDLDGYFL